MKTFFQFLSENTKPSFIFAIDHKGELTTSHSSDMHDWAFPDLFGGKESDYPPVWGRVEDGVVSMTTEHGHEPAVVAYEREGKRVNRYARKDALHRILAVNLLAARHPNLLIRSPNFGNRPFFHSPTEHIKYLTGLMAS